MSAIHEGSRVRLKGAYRYGDQAGQVIPAGTVGQVADIHGAGQGLAVEFTLREPVFGPGGDVVDFGKFELGFFARDEVDLLS